MKIEQTQDEKFQEHLNKRHCQYLDAKIRFGHRFQCKMTKNAYARHEYEAVIKGEGPQPTDQQLIDLCDGGAGNFGGGVVNRIGILPKSEEKEIRYKVDVYID